MQRFSTTDLQSLTFWDQEGQLHLLLQRLVRDALSCYPRLLPLAQAGCAQQALLAVSNCPKPVMQHHQ